MTVGIYLMNNDKKEAVVLADSCVSQGQRQSHSVNKIGEFNTDNYHGVLYGAGDGNLLWGAIQQIRNIINSKLEEFVSNVYITHKNQVDHDDMNYLRFRNEEIMKESNLYLPNQELIIQSSSHIPDEQKDQAINSKMEFAWQRYNDFIEKRKNEVIENYERNFSNKNTSMIIMAFDKEKEIVRPFYINLQGYNEIYMNHIEIGSGTDGSNMYLSNILQGMSKKKLKTEDLVFHVVNAYNKSTVNSGVGGVPTILNVKEENKEYNDTQIKTLLNLSGAYLSGFNDEKLTNKQSRKYVAGIINNEGIEKELAEILEVNVDVMKTMAIPYSIWQDRANQKLYD